MRYPLHKRYPTLADIAEMKASGYDRDTLERAREDHQRGLTAREVCSEIRAAFKGVTLGNGIGLSQARALDDHVDHAASSAYRENDEKDDWERIPKEVLDRYRGSLVFLDAEGMRFHLPAYLIADLEGESGHDMGWELTLTGYSRFSLLNKEQRMAVRSYLQLLASDPDHTFDRPAILSALEDFREAD
ncbi:MAG: hypothetical protein EOP88_19765 [Verrucomicrobiaceae bacterium]|nr:MAG: hypothetical protein EOP88_19765 [Verrucomicrobiaceae bacterium]